MTKDKFTPMRLDEKEEAIVAEMMDRTGLGKAAAIRLIIREWAEMKKQYITIPKVGIIKGENGVITIEEELARR